MTASRRVRSLAERGSATVEFAMVLPAVVALLVLALSAGSWVLATMRAEQAAATAARVAITNTQAAATAAAHHVAPGAQVTVRESAGWVVVTVTVPFAGWGSATAQATAWAAP